MEGEELVEPTAGRRRSPSQASPLFATPCRGPLGRAEIDLVEARPASPACAASTSSAPTSSCSSSSCRTSTARGAGADQGAERRARVVVASPATARRSGSSVLRAGADDCVSQPPLAEEVVARIEALLRRRRCRRERARRDRGRLPADRPRRGTGSPYWGSRSPLTPDRVPDARGLRREPGPRPRPRPAARLGLGRPDPRPRRGQALRQLPAPQVRTGRRSTRSKPYAASATATHRGGSSPPTSTAAAPGSDPPPPGPYPPKPALRSPANEPQRRHAGLSPGRRYLSRGVMRKTETTSAVCASGWAT